jgi:predicted DNA binding protein
MSVVAEFTVPPSALPAGEALLKYPDIQIDIERVVPTEESALPFFWVWGPKPEAFMEKAREAPDIAQVSLLDEVDGGALFRAEWSPSAELIEGITELDATIIDATGSSDHWHFEVRTQERDVLNEFQAVFREQGIDIRLARLYDLTELVQGDTRSITPEQRETLLAAYREGYFEKPREISQRDLGGLFTISGRAVSDRLRRGTRNLIATTLLPSAEQ